MRAISALRLEAGTSTLGWRAWIAFRTRVSMSAMGSLVMKLLSFQLSALSFSAVNSCHRKAESRRLTAERFFSPTRLGHARNLAVQGELAEAQAANTELAQKRARTAAAPAAVTVPACKLGSLRLRARQHAGGFQFDIFRNLGSGGHNFRFSSRHWRELV